MSNATSSSTKFQKSHKRRQEYRANRRYREKTRPYIFKVAVLLVAVTLGISSIAIISTNNGDMSEMSSGVQSGVLPPPVIIENLKEKKLVALTFDDGPDPNTVALLDILEREKVTVTFFVLGMRADRYGDIVQRAYREGHQIANHTYHHKNLVNTSPTDRQAEINNTATAIERITGTRPTVLRPPYGDWNRDVMNDASVPLILWSIDTEDWKHRNAEMIYQHVMANVRDGSIILFHDLYPTSVDAVAKIIPALKSQGYVIVTVNRLIMTRGGSFAPGHYYRHLYP